MPSCAPRCAARRCTCPPKSGPSGTALRQTCGPWLHRIRAHDPRAAVGTKPERPGRADQAYARAKSTRPRWALRRPIAAGAAVSAVSCGHGDKLLDINSVERLSACACAMLSSARRCPARRKGRAGVARGGRVQFLDRIHVDDKLHAAAVAIQQAFGARWSARRRLDSLTNRPSASRTGSADGWAAGRGRADGAHRCQRFARKRSGSGDGTTRQQRLDRPTPRWTPPPKLDKKTPLYSRTLACGAFVPRVSHALPARRAFKLRYDHRAMHDLPWYATCATIGLANSEKKRSEGTAHLMKPHCTRWNDEHACTLRIHVRLNASRDAEKNPPCDTHKKCKPTSFLVPTRRVPDRALPRRTRCCSRRSLLTSARASTRR